MHSISPFCTVVIHDPTRRRLRRASVLLMVSLLSACATLPMPRVPGDGQVLAPLDSAAIARETGRRDAAILQRPRTAAFAATLIGTFAVEFAVLNRHPRAPYWIAPASVAGVSAGSAVWAYRETKQPIPAPPDSMRARYGLTEARLWDSYIDGFREEIDDRRRAELQRDSRAALVTAIVMAGVLVAFPRR